MSEKILQINFKFNVSGEDYTKAVSPLADSIAAVPGMEWKVWIINEDESEAGGIYLFKDSATLDDYLKSDIVDGVVKHPALSDFSVKAFDVMPEVTAICRGPVKQTTLA